MARSKEENKKITALYFKLMMLNHPKMKISIDNIITRKVRIELKTTVFYAYPDFNGNILFQCNCLGCYYGDSPIELRSDSSKENIIQTLDKISLHGY